MLKSIFLITMLSFTLVVSVNAQHKDSFQFSGGIMAAKHSNTGVSTALKFNKSVNEKFNAFISVGFSGWDKHKVFLKEFIDDRVKPLVGWNENEHRMFLVNAGGNYKIYESKLFIVRTALDFGYSFLKYNSYDNYVVTDEEGNVKDYATYLNSKKENKEHLLMIGLGVDVERPLYGNMSAVFSFNYRGNINTGYNKIFNDSSTIASYLLGINYYM